MLDEGANKFDLVDRINIVQHVCVWSPCFSALSRVESYSLHMRLIYFYRPTVLVIVKLPSYGEAGVRQRLAVAGEIT